MMIIEKISDLFRKNKRLGEEWINVDIAEINAKRSCPKKIAFIFLRLDLISEREAKNIRCFTNINNKYIDTYLSEIMNKKAPKGAEFRIERHDNMILYKFAKKEN